MSRSSFYVKLQVFYSVILNFSWADTEGGGGGGAGDPDLPLKNHKNIGFLCNTGTHSLEKSQSWRADGGPFIAVFIASIPHQLKKKKKKKKDVIKFSPL